MIMVLLIKDLGSKEKIRRNIKNSDKLIKIYIKNSKFSQIL